jgi:glutaredoxin 3
VDVKSKPERLGEMMKWSKGQRDVPVIVEDGKVTIGFGGS